MKRLFLLILPLVLTATAHAEEFQSLFNGKDLTGWAGKKEFWSVKDGSIFGQTTNDKPTTGNTFLVWQGGDVADFVFKAKVRFAGNNSGVQYRSELFGKADDFVVKGYQADLHPRPEYFGMLYAEKWRGIVARRFERVVVGDDGKPKVIGEVGDREQKLVATEWNELTIIAVGNRQIHQVNGVTTMDLTDNHPAAKRNGILALQLHAGAPMTVEFKDIRLRHLKGKDAEDAIDAVTQKAGNKATPVKRIKAAEGFKVELLYSVPGDTHGSWVNLCTDNKGRLLVSDQFGGMYRINPPASGETLNAADVQPVPASIRAVNGMVWAFDALYVGVNDYEKKIPSGLYRITDSNGDDNLDKVELLRAMDARGDHGVHAVVPSPDGKSLLLITGNSTKPTELAETSQVPQLWGEDHLLPSFPDGRGHNRGVLAPGGIIYRVDPDGKKSEAYANGFRNIFDAAFNRDGELFTYDADMEYDFNTPWYRPTRICQVTSGAEFGWRNGAGKRPTFFADNLPPVLDIGPGSPTGMTFGYGAKFPLKYQNALYALDWSWGKLYAVHLKPNGSSYTATKEEFITGAPLPITDAIIHPEDGAMYFTIGGRRVQSGLYRVTYVGDESTEPVGSRLAPANDKVDSNAAARETRHKLETFHGRQDSNAVKVAWPKLSHQDRYIRFAARTAIEHQPAKTWADKALNESDPKKQVEVLLALARVTGVCPQHRTDSTPPIDIQMRDKLLAAVLAIDLTKLDCASQLTLQRTLQIILNRFGRPNDMTVQKLIAAIDPLFPSESAELNWLLCETLAWLQSPTVAAKAMALIEAAPTQEEQVQYARSIRLLKTGWTDELHTAYFEWFLKASNYRGGASFAKFIEFIRDDALASLSETQKKSLKEVLAKKPVQKSALENLGAIFEGRSETKWTLDELSLAARTNLKQRDFRNGRRMFAAAGCYACHRFQNQGGMTGPDLTTAGRRYSAHDLLDQVIHPSKVINDQFSAVSVITDDGRLHTGVIVNLGVKRNGGTLVLNTDLSDPNERVSIDRNTIEELVVSKTSPMPAGLFDRMTKDEILDVIAYLMSGGDPKHEYFRK